MKVQMFKAVDSVDGKMSLFAVFGDEMRVSTYRGLDDDWLDKSKFFEYSMKGVKLDHSRMINPELIWESEE